VLVDKFPTFRFHKELAPEGRILQTQADVDALGAGWVDTPAAFDPNYVPPAASVVDDTVPSDAYAQTFVRVPFPSHRFNRAGESCLVNSQDEADALDPREWKETPDPRAWDEPGADATSPKAQLSFVPRPDAPSVEPSAAATPAPAAATPAPESGTLNSPSDAEAVAAQALAAKARELHATPVADVLKQLEGCPDATFLRKVKEMEMLNQNGPRVTLVRSIDAAIKVIVESPAKGIVEEPTTPATPAQ
jgi:hypothetical protein